MEDLLQETRKQLKIQKIITGLLAVLVAVMFAIMAMLAGSLQQMSSVLDETAAKIEEIDIDGINNTVSTTQNLLESVDELSDAIDGVTGRVKDFDGLMSGLFGN